LASALGDRAIFTGRLALERQIATVSRAISSKAAPSREKIAQFRLESTPPPGLAAPRTVAEVAAYWLSSLTGREITTADLDDSGPAELADQCRRRIAERHQTSRPADAPPAEPAPAGSADTTSDADRQD
jgi:hypothetical protein